MQRYVGVALIPLFLFAMTSSTSIEPSIKKQQNINHLTVVTKKTTITTKKVIKKRPKQPSRGQDYSDADFYWLSRVVSAEAKGESIEGQLAVANVIINRAKGQPIKKVVFAENQFESVSNGSIYDEPTPTAKQVAYRVLMGHRTFNDDDVVYFYNPRWTPSGSWIRTRNVVKVIGGHRFAK